MVTGMSCTFSGPNGTTGYIGGGITGFVTGNMGGTAYLNPETVKPSAYIDGSIASYVFYSEVTWNDGSYARMGGLGVGYAVFPGHFY